ncbi:MAG: murein L,D-transpeptidase catalytic domain-containing protein [Acidobacteriota bacterium]
MSTRWLPLAAAGLALAGCATDDPDVDSTQSALDITAFVLPQLTAAQRAPIVRKYDLLDPNDEVPRGLLEDAIVYYDVNQALIPQQHYFMVVDFSRYSGRDRFWLVDLTTGAVEHHKVAHGQGSDPTNDGYATSFSNVSGSYKSSLGFYLTGEIYDGTHPHSMRLDGLSPDGSPDGMADTNVRQRLIVVHEASYVSDSNTSQQGRSDGCLALDPAIEAGVVDRVHDGSLIYAETAPLNAPVGRAMCGDGTCDGAETADSCPADCTGGSGSSDLPADGDGGSGAPGTSGGGGCATGSGGGLVLALAALGLRRRRRGKLSR